ncbi:hypothetical protein CDEF62S_04863 [Castellaniella defragrans]
MFQKNTATPDRSSSESLDDNNLTDLFDNFEFKILYQNYSQKDTLDPEFLYWYFP